MERISVKKPFTVLVTVIVVIALGVVSMLNMTTDLLPEMSLPYLMIITTYPGASPEKVEAEVTLPMEQALGTVKNVQSVSSVSAENYCMVQLQLASGTDMDSAMVNVSSAVNRVSAGLPDGTGTPSILELSMDMIATMYIAVSREGYDIYELSEYVDQEIIPYLQRQNGVASVTAVGLVEQSVQVELNGEKIDALNDRILELTNETLSDARAQLDEAKRQVEDGQAALTEQQQRFGTTLASALFGQMEGPSAEMAGRLQEGLDGLIDTTEQMETALNAFDGDAGTENDLSYISSELLAAALALQVEPAQATNVLQDAGRIIAGVETIMDRQSLSPGLSEILDDVRAAGEARERAEAALAQGDFVTAQAEMDAMRALLERAAGNADAARNTLSQSRDEFVGIAEDLRLLGSDMRVLRDGLEKSREAGAFTHLLNAVGRVGAVTTRTWLLLEQISSLDLGGNLSEQTGALREALLGLSGRLEEYPELMNTLQVLLATLSQGQLDAAIGFAAAAQQLALAQSQLQSAESQYEQAKAQALKSANVDALVDAATLSRLIYAQNFAMPAGYIDDENDNSWLLRVGDEYGSSEDIAGALLVNLEGLGTVRISDVADITVIDNALESYASLNGGNGIMLCVYKGSTAGTNAVSKACLNAMAELRERDDALSLVRLLDQGKYITIIVNSILQSMALGAILAILVLALFLKDLRPTLVVGVSIPLSVLFALVLMYFTNLSLNMMTLSGLALGIGMLVDNSIVVLENIVRLRTRGMAAPRSAVQGTKQVAGAIIASTLTTISVFFPMVFTSGTVRELLVPLSLSVSYCLIASLLVAVTVIPASASTLLARTAPRPNRLMERVQRRYGTALRWCLTHKAVPLLVSLALLAVCLFRLLSIGIVILPEMTSDSVNITITVPEGTERAEAYRMADEVMERLLTLDGIEDVGIMDTSSVISSVGITAGGGSSGSFGNFICYITVPEGTGATAMRRLCRAAEVVTADLECTVSADTSSMMDFSSLTDSGLSITVYGRDMDRLTEIAAETAEIVRGVEGFTDVSDGSEDAAATLHLIIDKDKAMEYGLTVAQIYAEIAGRLTTEVSSTTITSDGLDMLVRVSNNTDPLTRENLLDMEFTAVSLTGGGGMADMMGAFAGAAGEADEEESAAEETAGEEAAEETEENEGKNEEESEETRDENVHALREFARLEETASAARINRRDLTRYVTVTAGVLPGYNTTVLSRSLREPLQALSDRLPYGYSVELGGESQQVSEMIAQMVQLAALGLLFIYLIMVAQFQSLLSPFIILFTIPLAFTGGMLALIVAGQQLSMLAIMGFLILMGTVVNNGIVFVDYANQLRLGGLEKHDALVATGQTRMRPILMTTLTTILAMAMLIFGDDMGSEMGGGMAIVITGGLLYATLMTLFIIPILYDIFYRRKPLTVDVGDDINDAPDDAAEFLEKLKREREAKETEAEEAAAAAEEAEDDETEPKPEPDETGETRAAP